MAWLGGMLQGYTQATERYRQQNADEDAANRAQETSIFSHLLNSPDPETQKLAIAGMLHSGDPRQRQGGLAGWVGKMRSSPYMGAIQHLSPMLESTETVAPEPSPRVSGGGALPGALPHPADAAQPAMSPTEVGAPPPATVQPIPTGSALPGALQDVRGEAPPTTRTVSRPRRTFMSPEEEAMMKAAGTQRGDVEGRIAGRRGGGATPEQALAPELMGARGGLGISHVAVETADGQQRFAIFDARRPGPGGVMGQYLDPDTGEVLTGAKPLTHTGSTSLGADREGIARELYGRPAVQLKGPEMAHVNAEVQRRQGILKPSAALAAASRMLPNATIQQQTELADALMAGTATPVSGPTAAPSAVGAPPPSGATPSEATPPGLTPGAPPPAPSAKPRLGAQVPPALAGASRETGKVDVTQRAKEKDRVYAVSQLEGTLKTIDALVPQVFPKVPEGVIGRVKTGVSLSKQEFGRRANYAKLEAAVASTIANIVRVNGVTQRLNQQELGLAKEQQINLSVLHGDTINTVQGKLKILRELAERVKGANVSGGIDVPNPSAVGATPPVRQPGPEWEHRKDGMYRNGVLTIPNPPTPGG